MNGLVGYVAPYDIEYGYGFRPYAGSSIEQKVGLLDIHIPYALMYVYDAKLHCYWLDIIPICDIHTITLYIYGDNKYTHIHIELYYVYLFILLLPLNVSNF